MTGRPPFRWPQGQCPWVSASFALRVKPGPCPCPPPTARPLRQQTDVYKRQRLNILCDNALMTGFRRREPVISRQVAQQVVAEIDEVQARPVWKRREAVVLASVLALAFPVWLYLG